jgi:hypothetical protein
VLKKGFDPSPSVSSVLSVVKMDSKIASLSAEGEFNHREHRAHRGGIFKKN